MKTIIEIAIIQVTAIALGFGLGLLLHLRTLITY